LPIVQNLIELHGGAFELLSELRKGTEAIVTLPKQRVLTAVPPLQPLGLERHREVSVRPGRHGRLRAVAS
jgi:two-component system cell cycle sensor histidine kinase PleC